MIGEVELLAFPTTDNEPSVPEPATLALLGASLLALAAGKRARAVTTRG
ncbi:MAG: PEP-CTERM sorting domain-containing protein [Burkholderiales bacterium]|nr:PEP-CTERM sorting domain-containing protein [Burkholderiales bacterium]